MSQLLFPKQKIKKTRHKHGKSILQQRDGTCYLCMRLNKDRIMHSYLECHHIFGGGLRRISEAEGLKVYLCAEHHRTGPEAVHRNADMAGLLKQDAQRAYEALHGHQEFMRLIGRNYLEE